MDELISAKRKLYSALLKYQPTEMTDTELNILEQLAKDRDIQKILEENA